MKEDPQFLTQQEVFNAHAEFGQLDKEMVKKGMGPNWPRAWDFSHPDIFERGNNPHPARVVEDR